MKAELPNVYVQQPCVEKSDQKLDDVQGGCKYKTYRVKRLLSLIYTLVSICEQYKCIIYALLWIWNFTSDQPSNYLDVLESVETAGSVTDYLKPLDTIKPARSLTELVTRDEEDAITRSNNGSDDAATFAWDRLCELEAWMINANQDTQ